MLERIIQAIIRFFASLGVLSFLVLLTFLGFLGNFMSVDAGLALSNFDDTPLSENPLLGIVLGSLFPDASMQNLTALALSMSICIGFIVLFNRIFFYLTLRREIRRMNNTEHSESLQQYYDVRRNCRMLLALVGAFLFCAVTWDIYLFNTRYMISVLGLNSVSELTAQSGLKVNLIRTGMYIAAVGYLGITGLMAMFLEMSFARVQNAWAHMLKVFSDIIGIDPEQTVFQAPPSPPENERHSVPSNPVEPNESPEPHTTEPSVADVSNAPKAGKVEYEVDNSPADTALSATEEEESFEEQSSNAQVPPLSEDVIQELLKD